MRQNTYLFIAFEVSTDPREKEEKGNLLNFYNYNVLYIYLHNFFLDKRKDYSLYSVNGSFIGDGRNVFISNTF
jgi:hypothetical protein